MEHRREPTPMLSPVRHHKQQVVLFVPKVYVRMPLSTSGLYVGSDGMSVFWRPARLLVIQDSTAPLSPLSYISSTGDSASAVRKAALQRFVQAAGLPDISLDHDVCLFMSHINRLRVVQRQLLAAVEPAPTAPVDFTSLSVLERVLAEGPSTPFAVFRPVSVLDLFLVDDEIAPDDAVDAMVALQGVGAKSFDVRHAVMAAAAGRVVTADGRRRALQLHIPSHSSTNNISGAFSSANGRCDELSDAVGGNAFAAQSLLPLI